MRLNSISMPVAVAAAMALSAPPASPAEEHPVRGGILHMAQRAELKTFNPVMAIDAPSREVLWRLHGDLLTIDRVTQNVTPGLAESWTQSRDGMRYTLKLRQGLRFSDGAACTADDVLFSWAVYLDEAVHAPQRDLLLIDGKPIQASRVDGRTVQFVLPQPYAAAERLFDSVAILPRHKLEVSYAADSPVLKAAIQYRNVSPSILGQRGVPLGPAGDSQGIEGAQALPYNIGTRATEWVSHTSPIPVGFWRSVGASVNTFCVESLVDELAALAGQDPYMFRRTKLTNSRWIAVLDAAATLGNWTQPPPSGHYRGIAIGTAFNSIVAEVVEISSVSATSLRVNRVSLAIDLYLPVNPGQIEAQMTGGIVHGLNAALYGQQTFVNGAAQARNFNKSRMIRLGEMPQVAVTIVPGPVAADRTVAIGGAGELGVPTFAPALANAYFKATGKRHRSLPFFPGATMGDL